MNFNLSTLSGLFEQIDTNIEAYLLVDGDKYEISAFNIAFGQVIDHKGQPQHEVQGGQIIISITQIPKASIYDWAKRSNKPKSGQILFQTETRGTILDIKFEDAHCVSFNQKINFTSGTEVSLGITPKRVIMGEFIHNNNWVE